MTTKVRLATISDLDDLTGLFNGYRQFYQQRNDQAACRAFLAERLAKKDSTVLLAIDVTGTAVGFTQLYPSFSSVSAGRIWILNDLFVAPEARRSGAARALMQAAHAFARDTGALRVVLSTHRLNEPAQRLYQSLGYRKDEEFVTYQHSLA